MKYDPKGEEAWDDVTDRPIRKEVPNVAKERVCDGSRLKIKFPIFSGVHTLEIETLGNGVCDVIAVRIYPAP